MNLSEEQILSLAPDESSKKSGKELANTSKWVKRESSDRALWGECQGSGKLPYQTQIDLTSIAFKCSCPSRKFPCKHGLGLLLLYARDKKLFSSANEPVWVTGWLDKRTEKEEKKSDKKEKEKKVDPAAQAKRQETRLKRVEEGMTDLRLWIKDIIRNGLLNIPGKEQGYFESMEKRMVDAQAPGLANMIRSLREVSFFQDGWQTQFLDQLIRIYIVLEGFPRLENLPIELQDEIKTLVGFTQNQDEVKAEIGLRDDWFVLAKRTNKDDNLSTERNWLYGLKSKRFALILQFYVKGQLPEVTLVPGSCIDATLVYFKGANSLRGLIKEQFQVKSETVITAVDNWDEVSVSMSEIHALNPWTNNLPVIVDNVVPLKTNDRWILKDQNGKGVLIYDRFHNIWKLMSVSGGKPVRIFAIGNENVFEPLGAWMNNRYIMLT